MKKKVLWAVITTVLSVLTIYTLFYNSGLSLTELWEDIEEASPIWLIPAALCMLGFIFFEGRSLVLILRTLGYPAKKDADFYMLPQIFIFHQSLHLLPAVSLPALILCTKMDSQPLP